MPRPPVNFPISSDRHALRGADTLVHRRHDEVLEHVRIGLLEQRGLDAELHHLELATHTAVTMPPPALASTVRSASSCCNVRDLLLQLLRLPEEPAQVEALAHHALPAPIPHAAHLGAEDLDRGLHHRIGERLLGAPPGLRERRLTGVLARQWTHFHPSSRPATLARDGTQALEVSLRDSSRRAAFVVDSDAERFTVGCEQVCCSPASM